MLNRRSIGRFFSAGAVALFLALVPTTGWGDSHLLPAAEPDDEGLYTQPWFLNSFFDLREDMAESAAEGKQLVIIWEQRGCPYCREMHLVNFATPAIRDYVEANFEIVQMDLRGARQTTDFDGKAMTERELAQRHGVRFTPTIQFFPETVAELAGQAGKAAEVARMAGYFRPHPFLAMFKYVREKRYADGDFRSYLKTLPRI